MPFRDLAIFESSQRQCSAREFRLKADSTPNLCPSQAAIVPISSARTDLPFVVAQLGQSLDGRIATLTGESRWINRDAALDHVHRLRSDVDAVVVGIGTALADDPLLTVRRVTGRNPARVVIDPRLRLPLTARCLGGGDGAQRILICSHAASAHDGIDRIPIALVDGVMPPNAIIAALFERGFKRLLIEGGATTVSTFIDAGVVDRLHVLVAPIPG